jgi:hypothetical protein
MLRAADAASGAAAPPSPAPAQVLPASEPAAAPSVTTAGAPDEAPLADASAPATSGNAANAEPVSAPTGRASMWLTALLVAGVVVLLSAPLVLVRRRKRTPVADEAAKAPKPRPRKLVDPVAGFDVVEGSLDHEPTVPVPAVTLGAKAAPVPATTLGAKVAGVPAPGALIINLDIDPNDTVDLDVGAPVLMGEGIDWFGDRVENVSAEPTTVVGDEPIEENAATAVMQDFASAPTMRQPAPPPAAEPEQPKLKKQPKAKAKPEPIDDEQMTLTVVELDLLRQDYEAEHTLTQQSSKALNDAVAELKATQAALAATAETSTLEIPQQAQSDAEEELTQAKTARLRIK